MSGSLIRILPFWTNTMRSIFLIFVRKYTFLAQEPLILPNTMRGLLFRYGRSGCSFYRVSPPNRRKEVGEVFFFWSILPQERQASESASGLAFVHSCKSKRRLHVE